MIPRQRREPMRFTRGGRAYIITATYAANDDGFLGLCDGRVVARAADRAEVARALINGALVTDGSVAVKA